MGQESDFKTQLVLEICSISARTVLCVHRLVSKAPFVDWYHILGVSSSFFMFMIQSLKHFSGFFLKWKIYLHGVVSDRWKKMQERMQFARDTINLVGLIEIYSICNLHSFICFYRNRKQIVIFLSFSEEWGLFFLAAALQLHPDKNKHPKAEMAFKLVSEVSLSFSFYKHTALLLPHCYFMPKTNHFLIHTK